MRAKAFFFIICTILFHSCADHYDIVIKNGKVFDGSGADFQLVDIGIKGDKIVKIGNIQLNSAHDFIDAEGLRLVPGLIDLHVHLTPVQLPDEEIKWVDDFQSGTKAAATGGITTIGGG